MRRSVRWLAVCAATAALFVGSLWLAWVLSWPLGVRAESDRWVVAAGFAVAMAAAAMTAVGWWAGREETSPHIGAHGSRLAAERPVGGDEQASTLAQLSGGDHIDFRGGTFNAPVTGKGDIHIGGERPRP